MTAADPQSAGETEAAGEEQTLQQFVTFVVRGEEYGCPIMRVREIRPWSDTVTRLPNQPSYVRGVINLRGTIIPIFDLRARFHGELTDAGNRHVVITAAAMVQGEEKWVGFLVDAVTDILSVSENELRALPQMERTINESYLDRLAALEERTVATVDIDRLVGDDLMRGMDT